MRLLHLLLSGELLPSVRPIKPYPSQRKGVGSETEESTEDDGTDPKREKETFLGSDRIPESRTDEPLIQP